MTWADRLVPVPPGRSGRWQVRKITVPAPPEVLAGYPLDPAPPGVYTSLEHDERGVVMIDAPAVLASHEESLDRAHGHVMLAGLGLGAWLHAVHRRPAVDRVTVVEHSPDVIDLVWPSYAHLRGVRLLVADVQMLDPRQERCDFAFLDIWDDDSTVHAHARAHEIARWQAAGVEVMAWHQDVVERRLARAQ